MAQPASVARLYGTGLAALGATLLAMMALPHAPAIRWQSVRTEAFARLGWVQQRVQDDPTPIDIALIGTSHMMNGLDGQAVATRLAQSGLRGEDGRCLTVTNLAIPSYGRNLHWELARELLTTRHPRLLVLEVLENETRKAHPLFYRVATTQDALGAPALINTNYAADLVRLPWRQMALALQTLAPGEFGLKTRWAPADYDGSTVDNTRVVNVDGQALTPLRDRVMPPAALAQASAQAMRAKNLHMLPAAWADSEYAVPERYLGGIFQLADATHTPVLLLYLPGYGRPDRPIDMRWYQGRHMVDVNTVLRQPAYWYDQEHLNRQGAIAASAGLADRLAAALAGQADMRKGPRSAAGCQFGYGPRPRLRPFRRPEQPAA